MTDSRTGLIGNGSRIALDAAATGAHTYIVRVTSIKPDETGVEIDVSDLDDTDQIIEIGMIQKGVEVTVIGSTTLTMGQKVYAWLFPRGAAVGEELGWYVVTKKPREITKNATINTVISLKKTKADV